MKRIITWTFTLILLANFFALELQALNKKKKNIQRLASDLYLNLKRPSLKNRTSVLVSFVNLNNLEKSSPTGRFLQEQLSIELFKLGFRIKEIRNSNIITYKQTEGEFNLSRNQNPLDLSKNPNIESIISGTYLLKGKKLYIYCRMLHLKSGLVVSAAQTTFQISEDRDNIRNNESKKKRAVLSYERFPNSKVDSF